MRTTKLFLTAILLAFLSTSCTTEVLIEDDYIAPPVLFDAAIALETYDLWYVDINETIGNGEVPFLQRAFTISFDRGKIRANNNLVGLGKTGNGLGITVGYYNPAGSAIDIAHDVDGNWILEAFEVNGNTLELRDPRSDTSYFLKGYQRSNFDYDLVYYDNIQYFLQEYDAWEKVYTSEEGAINEFDDENFLQFFNSGVERTFRSSVDPVETNVNDLVWDFVGNYQVYDIESDETLKTLTLDYDFMDNDYFELYVINDATIELYHPSSETVYEFSGRGHTTFLKTGKSAVAKKRTKTKNPVMNVTRSRKK